ncbi:cAMP-binding domain of CRP or a regulatory subunit of cAMP-dependent protein kinases [Paracoccus aminovorans]|uniref:cAMP-binding domain of CRP or a regulatory subunit of cAMP-dependent protein kinases n=1 Tax=Paracoccus aminovorans TaxID=34004 RepID=A0A1I3CID1_9RHOB|nr:Crp/Fnr family transcriptional regulator [Paracoccus aminovorans]CQR87138.1 Crp/Fnr family transcriptional regulator [Paracoccus aminovorans]SFH74354.1 cAMP-binding domain of CRP or a regulatory subunit of cAMP-dependent protein kinases [Paracoccus aminovorans]
MAITEYFVRYLQRRDQLSGADIDRLRAVQTTHVAFRPGEVIVPRGRLATRSCMMLRGMSARQHALVGRPSEHVITALHVPGDFVDLHGFVLAGLEHEVVSVGDSEVEFVDHCELREITDNFPHLTRLLWMSTVIDAAIHRQWLVAAASLRSSGHLAHLLCELYIRLASVGAAQDHRFTLPLLQKELANILGYTPIHVNRAVRDLRAEGLIRWNGSEVEILDWQGLVRLARFNPEYLELDRVRR